MRDDDYLDSAYKVYHYRFGVVYSIFRGVTRVFACGEEFGIGQGYSNLVLLGCAFQQGTT